jgi:hypothetical protein
VSPPRLGFLLVQGELVFDRQDLSLEADTVFVHGGALTIGTEAEPFTHSATITIHGSRWTAKELPEIGAKFFGTMSHHGDGMVSTGAKKAANAQTVGIDWATVYTKPFRRGVIDVHGIPRKRVWTKLGATAVAGSSAFCSAEEMDLRPGEVVVLTSTSPNPYEAEEVAIGAVLNATCYLTMAPLKHTHSSRILAGADYQYGRDVDLRGEVGLLTRNIVIQGGGGQQQDDELFGMHLGAFHGGTLRLENAELRKCGQAFQSGRYCESPGSRRRRCHFGCGFILRTVWRTHTCCLPLARAQHTCLSRLRPPISTVQARTFTWWAPTRSATSAPTRSTTHSSAP